MALNAAEALGNARGEHAASSAVCAGLALRSACRPSRWRSPGATCPPKNARPCSAPTMPGRPALRPLPPPTRHGSGSPRCRFPHFPKEPKLRPKLADETLCALGQRSTNETPSPVRPAPAAQNPRDEEVFGARWVPLYERRSPNGATSPLEGSHGRDTSSLTGAASLGEPRAKNTSPPRRSPRKQAEAKARTPAPRPLKCGSRRRRRRAPPL